MQKDIESQGKDIKVLAKDNKDIKENIINTGIPGKNYAKRYRVAR